MKHAHFDELYTAYLEGTLPESRRQQVEAHLSQCPRCATELVALRLLVADLRAMPPELPPAQLTAGVRARIAAHQQPQPIFPRWPAFAGGLAVVAIALFFICLRLTSITHQHVQVSALPKSPASGAVRQPMVKAVPPAQRKNAHVLMPPVALDQADNTVKLPGNGSIAAPCTSKPAASSATVPTTANADRVIANNAAPAVGIAHDARKTILTTPPVSVIRAGNGNNDTRVMRGEQYGSTNINVPAITDTDKLARKTSAPAAPVNANSASFGAKGTNGKVEASVTATATAEHTASMAAHSSTCEPAAPAAATVHMAPAKGAAPLLHTLPDNGHAVASAQASKSLGGAQARSELIAGTQSARMMPSNADAIPQSAGMAAAKPMGKALAKRQASPTVSQILAFGNIEMWVDNLPMAPGALQDASRAHQTVHVVQFRLGGTLPVQLTIHPLDPAQHELQLSISATARTLSLPVPVKAGGDTLALTFHAEHELATLYLLVPGINPSRDFSTVTAHDQLAYHPLLHLADDAGIYLLCPSTLAEQHLSCTVTNTPPLTALRDLLRQHQYQLTLAGQVGSITPVGKK